MASEGSGCLKFALIGCGVILLLVFALAVGGFFYVKERGAELIVTQAVSFAGKMVQTSDLSDEEKADIDKELARISERYSDDVSFTEIGQVGQTLAESPFVGLFMAEGFKSGIKTHSTLPDEEKAEGEKTLERLQRGIVEKTIPREAFDQIFEELEKTSDEGNDFGQGEELSAEDFRKVLASMKQVADEADIPDETYEVDFVLETRKAVDLILGEDTVGDEGTSAAEIQPATAEVQPATP